MQFTTFLLLLATVAAMALGNVLKKLNKKPVPVFFSLCSTAATLIFFVILFLLGGESTFTIDENMLKYALPYGVCFTVTTLFTMLAVSTGDLSLTGLFISFSLIIPTLYGIIFLNDSVTVWFYIGLLLFFACLILTNVKFGGKNKTEKKPVSLKWIIYVALAAVSNGFTSLLQTAHQKSTGGKFGSEFMIISLAFACVVFAVVVLFSERKKIDASAVSVIPLGAIVGVLVGLLNYLVMLFTGQNLLPVAVFFPVISGGTLIVTFAFGYFFYKEKYDIYQYIGILCGLISVILLNL